MGALRPSRVRSRWFLVFPPARSRIALIQIVGVEVYVYVRHTLRSHDLTLGGRLLE